jgi:hypothetical protein
MQIVKKVVSGLVFLLLINGCSTTEQNLNDKVQLNLVYSESWAYGITRSVNIFFKPTEHSTLPSDLQPFNNHMITNSRITICETKDSCILVPLYIHIEYQMKKTDLGYEIKGKFITEPTLESSQYLLDPISISFEMTNQTKQVIHLENKLGASLSISRQH